jgi:fibronectin-binding autotransporter adhesin
MFRRTPRRRLVAAGAAVASLVSASLVLNGIQPASAAPIHSWTGLGGNASWGTAGNWDTGTPTPGAAEDLIFPVHAANEQPNNNLGEGATFDSITVNDDEYQLVGQAVEINTLTTTHATGEVNAAFTAGANGGVIVPAGGLDINVNGAGTLRFGTQIGIQNRTIDLNVTGKTTGGFSFFPVAAGATINRSGTGVTDFTSGGGATAVIAYNQSAGTTFFNANNQFAVEVLQTGGVIGGQNGNLDGLTVNGGTYSPGNLTFDSTQMVLGDFTMGAGGTFEVDINTQSDFDRIFVQDDAVPASQDGEVTLGGTIVIDATGFLPAAGQTYTIIQNDADGGAINGTFSNLADGATITVNGVDMVADYQGGDGNDFTLSTGPAFVWDGDGGNGNWSTPGNWVGGVAPTGNGTESLVFANVFDPGTTKTTVNNVGGTYKDIVIDSAQYSFAPFGGNVLTITGNLTSNNGGDTNTFTTDVVFAGGGTIQIPNTGQLTFNGSVDAGGATITIAGQGNPTFAGALVNGQLAISGPGAAASITGNSPTFAGPVTVDALGGRSLFLSGTLGEAAVVMNSVNNGFFGGSGTADGITVTNGTMSPSAPLSSDPGLLTSTEGFSLTGSGTYAFEVQAALGDRVDVQGTVTLTNGIFTAQPNPSNPLPPTANSYTMISNDGADAVVGTLRYDANPNDPNSPLVPAPEGFSLLIGGLPYTLSYVGGTGNDVTLSVVNADTWDGGGANDNWSTGLNWVDDTAPTDGATLIFPDGPADKNTANDIVGLDVDDIVFSGTAAGYTLGGAQSVTLDGNVSSAATTGTNTISLPLVLTGGGIFTGVSGGVLTSSGTVNIGGAELELKGAGQVSLNGTYSNGQIDVDFGPGGGFAVLTTDQAALGGGVEVDEGQFLVDTANIGPGGVAVHAGGNATLSGTIAGTVVADGNAFIAAGTLLDTTSAFTTTGLTTAAPGGIGFELNGAAATDRDVITVNGAVNAGGFLSLSTANPAPPLGVEIVLIQNDGVDPINGTYTGVADGGTVTVNTFDGVVNYDGGDGNDLSITFPPTFRWDGGAATDNMTLGANWVGDAAPTGNGGETLIFEDGATSFTPINDFDPATDSFDTIRFSAGSNSYTISGAVALVVDNIIESTGGLVSHTISAPVDLPTGGTISGGGGGVLAITGAIDAGAFDVVFSGAGGASAAAVTADAIIKSGIGTATLTASLATINDLDVQNGQLVVLDVVDAPAAVGLGRLQGDGSVDGITATGGFIDPGGNAAAVLTSTDSVDLGVNNDVVIDVNGTTPGTDQDQLVVTTGGLTLAGELDLNGFTALPPGTTVTIIDKQSAGAISGAFSNAAEGATVIAGNAPNAQSFTITYAGGTGGNDVVLTAGPVASLSDDAITIVEGDAGTTDVGLAVELDAPSATDVVTTVTATGGDATNGTDFSLTSAVTVPAGDTSAPVVFTITGEEAPEIDETVEVTLAVTSGAVLGTPSEAVVTIDDDDLSTLTITDPVIQIVEGGASVSAAATSTLTITLDGPSEDDIGVQVATADGTATAPADYAAIATTFTIPAGQTSFVIPLSVVADGIDEPNETFLVRFLAATGALLDIDDVTATILDDDVVQVVTTTSTTRPGGSTGGSNLSRTGTESSAYSIAGFALIVFGGALVLVGRRRRTA